MQNCGPAKGSELFRKIDHPGGIKMSNITRKRRKPIERNERGSGGGRFKLYFLMFASLVILVSGFFLAARQHFSSIDYGIRNSRLRKQLDDLEAEKRRLMVSREIALSPSEIKKAAKKYGMTSEVTEVAALVTGTKDIKQSGPATVQLVRPTVSSAPTTSTIPAAFVNSGAKVQKAEVVPIQPTSPKVKPGKPQLATVSQNRRPTR